MGSADAISIDLARGGRTAGQLRVTFHRGGLLQGEMSGGNDPWIERAQPLRAQLRELEPQMFGWLQASEENAQAFASDPVAALQAAVPGVSPQLIEALRNFRQETSP